jgi:hypothetical protein
VNFCSWAFLQSQKRKSNRISGPVAEGKRFLKTAGKRKNLAIMRKMFAMIIAGIPVQAAPGSLPP